MKAIEEKMAKAIRNGKNFHLNNTEVAHDGHRTGVYLHSNTIVVIDWIKRTVHLNSCGWPTVTTKSRINAVLEALGLNIHIQQKDNCWWLTDGVNRVAFRDGMYLQITSENAII